MDYKFLIVISAIVTILSIIYIVAMCKASKKYADIVNALGDSYGEIYCAGFGVLDMMHFNYNSNYSKKMMKYHKIIHGEKYAEFYFRIHMAKKISITLLTGILGLVVSVLMKEIVILGLAIVATAVVYYYFETTVTDIINARTDSIVAEFSEVLSKLALLVNAGMIVREAWEKVSTTGEGVLYDEMRTSVLDMQNGTSEIDAILKFAYRCNVESVTKFASTLVQNLSKGNRELVEFLKQFSNESWVEKKQYARTKGEEASGKLLIPIALMFLGLLIMICVPIFLGMTF